ncbi:MAG: GIDE domain-containing protein, partial [Elusimicrobiota bacterium]|nr:GIDE domain-containing protein [Elusimicrobiota bacterium]
MELYGIKSLIENIPTSKIRSIPMGIVELKGEAFAKYPVETKLNSVNCVFYKYKVEKMTVRGYGKNRRRSWKVIAEGQSITPFYIKDSTGTVLIEPFSCDAAIERKYYHSEGYHNGAKRYSEWYISPGEKLYVIGYAGKSGDVMAGRKEKLLTRLKEIRASAEERKKYDLNDDGRLDDHEWLMAVSDIKKAISIEEGTDGLCDVAVSGRGADKMLISDKSEKELLKRFTLKSFF